MAMARVFYIVVVIVPVLVAVLKEAAAAKKNVLLIIGDDTGIIMGAYNNTASKTPNMDRLAARGVVFKHGYTSVSSCSPSRSVILTGLPTHQNGMYGLHHSVNHFQSFDQVKSLPVILGTHGIRTGIIGKKHVGPDTVYKFDFEQTEENNNLDQVGRNITCMKNYMRQFLHVHGSSPFMLYMAFFDTHRAKQGGRMGDFAERFGNGEPGMGVIPDWKPINYGPDDVEVPPYLPDTPATRLDLAHMYTGFSRLDQGVGLFMTELENFGVLDDTLIIFSADNGIPFPNAKTNLYEPGMQEPMIVSDPTQKATWGQQTEALGSTMDIVPTILDWFGINYPSYRINNAPVTQLTGQSLLRVMPNPNSTEGFQQAYASHQFHEATMYYPMRVIRTPGYRLIQNLNNLGAYPLATDLYAAPTFQDILNRTAMGIPTHWFKTLQQYYYRAEWELFDESADPLEVRNLAGEAAYQDILTSLAQQLLSWRHATQDPWLCSPWAVLMTTDNNNNQCWTEDNGIFNGPTLPPRVEPTPKSSPRGFKTGSAQP